MRRCISALVFLAVILAQPARAARPEDATALVFARWEQVMARTRLASRGAFPSRPGWVVGYHQQKSYVADWARRQTEFANAYRSGAVRILTDRGADGGLRGFITLQRAPELANGIFFEGADEEFHFRDTVARARVGRQFMQRHGAQVVVGFHGQYRGPLERRGEHHYYLSGSKSLSQAELARILLAIEETDGAPASYAVHSCGAGGKPRGLLTLWRERPPAQELYDHYRAGGGKADVYHAKSARALGYDGTVVTSMRETNMGEIVPAGWSPARVGRLGSVGRAFGRTPDLWGPAADVAGRFAEATGVPERVTTPVVIGVVGYGVATEMAWGLGFEGVIDAATTYTIAAGGGGTLAAGTGTVTGVGLAGFGIYQSVAHSPDHGYAPATGYASWGWGGYTASFVDLYSPLWSWW